MLMASPEKIDWCSFLLPSLHIQSPGCRAYVRPCKPQAGGRRWGRKKKNLRRERTQGWENRGNSLLKKFIFQKKKKKFHHSAICISDPRAPRRKSKKANVHCNASEGTLLSSAYLRNRKGLWLGTLPLKNRSSQKSAHRIQPHNQPDTKIQRCNYYPLKPNV